MKRTLTLVVAAACLALTGCKASYEVNVRNDADQPITAEMRQGSPKGRNETLIRERIGPGDRATLGPQRVGAFKNVFLAVDFEGNTDLPATTKLRKGLSAVNVNRADDGSRGTVTLETKRP